MSDAEFLLELKQQSWEEEIKKCDQLMQQYQKSLKDSLCECCAKSSSIEKLWNLMKKSKKYHTALADKFKYDMLSIQYAATEKVLECQRFLEARREEDYEKELTNYSMILQKVLNNEESSLDDAKRSEYEKELQELKDQLSRLNLTKFEKSEAVVPTALSTCKSCIEKEEYQIEGNVNIDREMKKLQEHKADLMYQMVIVNTRLQEMWEMKQKGEIDLARKELQSENVIVPAPETFADSPSCQ